MGEHMRAVELHQQTLDDRIRISGPDHPLTLTSRNNLAFALDRAGEYARAVELHQQTLDDRIRVLGPEHPDTLTSRQNLEAALAASHTTRRRRGRWLRRRTIPTEPTRHLSHHAGLPRR